jgi:hypothetical protein
MIRKIKNNKINVCNIVFELNLFWLDAGAIQAKIKLPKPLYNVCNKYLKMKINTN